MMQFQQNRLSKAEMAHLRLAAGAAMLKICEQKGVGDQFTAEQFYNLSHLMVVSTCFFTVVIHTHQYFVDTNIAIYSSK